MSKRLSKAEIKRRKDKRITLMCEFLEHEKGCTIRKRGGRGSGNRIIEVVAPCMECDTPDMFIVEWGRDMERTLRKAIKFMCEDSEFKEFLEQIKEDEDDGNR